MDLPLPSRTALGREAEVAVARYLSGIGYRIEALNLRLGYLEVDIVARDGPVIALVEVRRRGASSRTTGFGSMTARKKLLLRRAGERLWNRRYKNDPSVERLRFDFASVRIEGTECVIEYVRGAF